MATSAATVTYDPAIRQEVVILFCVLSCCSGSNPGLWWVQETALRKAEADRLALLDELHASEAFCHEQTEAVQKIRSSKVESDAEVQVLQAMLVDAEARVHISERVAAAAPTPEALEAVNAKVRLFDRQTENRGNVALCRLSSTLVGLI
jgi:hypothetical protein